MVELAMFILALAATGIPAGVFYVRQRRLCRGPPQRVWRRNLTTAQRREKAEGQQGGGAIDPGSAAALPTIQSGERPAHLVAMFPERFNG